MNQQAATLPESTTGPRTRAARARQSRGAPSAAIPVLALIVGTHLAVVAAQSDFDAFGRANAIATVGLVAAAALVATLSRRRTVRATGAIGLGLLGTAAGLAIAPVWLWTAGASPTALAATVGLAASICLLAYGAGALLLALPGWWRLLAIPLGFLLIQFALIPLSGAVYGTHPPRAPLSASIPKGAEAVSFTTSDGIRHVAWYTPSRHGGAVVLLPGSGGDKGSTRSHAARLASHGYGVLALDARGTGESGGMANAWGWHGEADVRAAVDWLSGRPEVGSDAIGIVGLSMGGEIAITAAAADPRIAAVVAEGVSARVPDDLVYLPSDLTGTIHRLEATIMWAAADLMSDARAPEPLRDLVPALGSRLLLIVGRDADESAAAVVLRAAAPAVSVWALPDTAHIQALSTHPLQWETRVTDFLAERLGRVGSRAGS